MKHHVFGQTDVGRVRDHNEDSLKLDENIGLYVVCDGMGGHAAGEVASAMACEVIHAVVKNNFQAFLNFEANPTIETREAAEAVCTLAIQTACKEIYAVGQADPAKAGMGTTCVMMVYTQDHVIFANVGDSRGYMFRSEQVHQVTNDHSLVSEQLRKGLITPEEASKTAFGSVLTRAVGSHESVDVDTISFEIMPGDMFLICSDGLTDYLTGRDMMKMRDKYNLEDLPDALIDMANRRGGKDNITTILVEVEGKLDKNAITVQRKVEALKQIPLFQSLDYSELLKILNIISVENYNAEQTIIKEGTDSEELYVLLSGSVRVEKKGQHLADLDKGAFFGEMGLLDKSPRSADIIANTDSKLMVLNRNNFFLILRREYQLSQKVLWSFCQVLNERLRETSNQLSDVKSQIENDLGTRRVETDNLADLFDS